MENNNLLNSNLTITPQLKSTLYTISTWAKIVAIIAFVGQAMNLLASLVDGSFIISFIVAAIVIYINVQLFNFSTNLKTALNADDEGYLIESFANLRRYFNILFVIMIILVILVIIGVITTTAYYSFK